MIHDFDDFGLPCLCVPAHEFDKTRKNLANGSELINVLELNGVVIIPFNYVADIRHNMKGYPNSWISMLDPDIFYFELSFFEGMY